MIASGFAFRFNNEVTSSDVDKPLCYAQPYLNTSRKLAHQICKSPYVAFLSALGVILPSSPPKRLVFRLKKIGASCFYFWFVCCFEYGELVSQHLHGGIRSARWRSGDWRSRALRHRSVHRCRRFQHVCYFKYWYICKRYICISFALPVAVLFASFLFIVNSSILGER